MREIGEMTKEQERERLNREIWAVAEGLRGIIDGWDFKSYLLCAMFYRYLSERLTDCMNKGGVKNYAHLSDAEAEQGRAYAVQEKGFFLLPSELFENVCAESAELSETLGRVFSHLEESSKGGAFADKFAGLFADFDVNSHKLGDTATKRSERLSKLLRGVAGMKLSTTDDHEADVFGDAYEFLITMYASHAGKSRGEFFTPAEAAELLTRLAAVGKTEVNKVYDPTCGSGSLLLKAVKVLGKAGVRGGFFGQDVNSTSCNLCRINMLLHGVPPDKFHVACDDTLTAPHRWDDEPFELIVSNPPYSVKWAGDSNPALMKDSRFAPAGVLAPKSRADMAFILHCLAWLTPNGTAAIVCFPGILYRGGAEQKIRKYLVDNNFVDSVIQLPANLFFGTDIATSVLVIKKGKADDSVLFMDASREYIKVAKKNKLTPENIAHIVEAFTARQDKEYFCKRVPCDEIKAANYNLSVRTYVEPEDKRGKIDIKELNERIKRITARQQGLRAQIDKIIAEIEG